jgi:putative ABC transport system substrate-binding protein
MKVRRREFLALAGAAVVVCPLAGHTQQAGRVRRLGWLDLFLEDDLGVQARVAAFRQGMEKLGWVVGRNLQIDYRWGAFDFERARLAGAELLGLAPDVILAAGTPATLALQQATRTVPIVFAIVSEPVAQGIVQSLAHPGGNLTGFSYLEPTVGTKWLELLKEIAPLTRRVALMFNPQSSPYSQLFYDSMQAAAPKLAVETVVAHVHRASDIEQVMTMLSREPGGGLVVSPDAFNYTNRTLIVDLAARLKLPTIYGTPGTAAEGGLIYYCADIIQSYRDATAYIDRILRGEKPADLPVQQPTKFELTLNLKTARALGITVPQTLLVAADSIAE